MQTATDSTVVGRDARRKRIIFYGAVVFLYWMGLYLYVPTLPVYVQSKADDLALVGVVLSMYGLWQAVIRLPLGIAADWLGRRKPFILVGMSLVALGTVVMARAQGFTGLVVGRAITGLSAGTWVPLVVVFNSLFLPEESVLATSILTLVGSTSRMLATAVTGSLNSLGGYALAFYLAAAVAGLAFFIVLPIPEKRRPPLRPSFRSVGALITNPKVILPALLNMLVLYSTWSSTFSYTPVLAKQFGASDVILSALTSMNIAVVILGNLFTTMLAKRVRARRLVTISFVLLAVGLGIAALAPALPLVFVAQFCVGLGVGMGFPTLMGLSIKDVAGSERTTAMGLHQSVYAIGMFTGPWIGGILADAIGVQSMFGITVPMILTLGLIGTRYLQD